MSCRGFVANRIAQPPAACSRQPGKAPVSDSSPAVFEGRQLLKGKDVHVDVGGVAVPVAGVCDDHRQGGYVLVAAGTGALDLQAGATCTLRTCLRRTKQVMEGVVRYIACHNHESPFLQEKQEQSC